MSKHLKRLFAPKTWQILRKERKYISRPKPGPHSLQFSLPLMVAIRDAMGAARTAREVKYMLNNKTVLVNGKQRKDYHYPLGLFDVLTFKDTNQSYRVVLNSKGKLSLIKAMEPEVTIVRIINKSMVKGKLQLNLSDGSNLLIEKGKYAIGDSLALSNKEGKREVKEHLGLYKGATIILIGGKNIGATGKVEDIIENRIMYKSHDEVSETLKKYAFTIGKDKPYIALN